MSSFRSWLGGFLALVLFFTVRIFAGGYALPTFLALTFSVFYAWIFVLRISEVPLTKSKESTTRWADEGAKTQSSSCQGKDKSKFSYEKTDDTSRSGSKSGVEPKSADRVSGKSAQGDPAADAKRATTDAASEKQAEEDNEEEEGDFDIEQSHARKLEGNELFKSGRYEEALEVYSGALELCPKKDKEQRKHRAALHSNKAACMQHLGLWEEVQRECSKAIENDPKYLKALHRRCSAAERLEKWSDAVADLKKILELDPAQKAKMTPHLMMLEKRAADQFEKDKEEMIGKLKDLGNMVLGKFGMSVDNFKMEKDPNTGSYSMSYKS